MLQRIIRHDRKDKKNLANDVHCELYFFLKYALFSKRALIIAFFLSKTD